MSSILQGNDPQGDTGGLRGIGGYLFIPFLLGVYWLLSYAL